MHEHKFEEYEAQHEIKKIIGPVYTLPLTVFKPIHKINNIYMLYELADDDLNINENMILENAEILNNDKLIYTINTSNAKINRYYNHNPEDPTEKQIIYKISLNSLINHLIIPCDSNLSLKLNFNNKLYKFLRNIIINVEGIEYSKVWQVMAEPLCISYDKKRYLQTGNIISEIKNW